jgi:hypothetical protein
MANEYGPFDTEREALATRAAAVIKAAFDDHPGVGASVPEALKVMTDACEAHGVALGKLDLSFLQGVAWRETSDCVSLAGMITRAYLAGLAARDAGVEWGVRFTIGGVNERPLPSEEDARTVVASMRESRPEFDAVLITRTPEVPAGPWRLAEEGETAETEEGNGGK